MPSNDALARLTEQTLAIARKAGADAADAIAVSGQSISIDVLGGKLEQAERSEGVDLGLRVMLGQRQACVATSDTRPEALETLAERAVAMAALAPEDPVIGLADGQALAKNWDLDSLELADPADAPSPAALEETARRAEAAAADVAGVSQVEGTGTGYSRNEIFLSSSNGFAGGYCRTSSATHVIAITGSGTSMERDYCAEMRVFAADLPNASDIGRRAGERAVARGGAVKPPTGTYPVLFDERISSSLIGHLMSATNGSTIVRGASWARDLMGKRVLPEGIDLIEDPHRPRISSSKPFDGEGLPTQRRAVIEDGVLKSWTLDLATARKLGLSSTANAARGTTAPPSPSAGNLWLTHGEKDRDGLLADMGTGLLVTSMIGSTINPTTGDYSRGASGFWVENGKISHPVNECTIAGNLIEMLGRIVPANDGETHLSRVIPSLLVDGMVIAGA